MSACAITLTGTSGSLIINYDLGSNVNTISANFGDSIYIDSTATNVTYTTTSGNLTASSGCVTITNLPTTCYLFSWESTFAPDPLGLVFNAIVLNSTFLTITNSNYAGIYSVSSLISSIKTLSDSRIISMSYKIVQSSRQSNNNFLILKIIGNYTPSLQINNPVGTQNLYLNGVISSNCVPSGYTEIPNC